MEMTSPFCCSTLDADPAAADTAETPPMPELAPAETEARPKTSPEAVTLPYPVVMPTLTVAVALCGPVKIGMPLNR